MAEITTTFENTIETLLSAKRFNSLRDILTTINPADLAILFDRLPKDKIALIFRLLPKELAAETFVEMDNDLQEMLIRGFSDNELKDIVDELYLDDAVDLVAEMSADVVQRRLSQAAPETRAMINEMLKYPEDSAGSIMTTEFVSLSPTMTVTDAIQRIRRVGIDRETIDTCFVTDSGRHLTGTITIRTIILADESSLIGDLMDKNVISVHTTEDQESVAQMFAKYNFMTMPVVDSEGRLVGIVTVDDVIDVIQDEATEDMEIMAAITPTDKPYLKTSVFEIWKSRIPWLLILMISATFTGSIITHFEDALSMYVVLTAFIPMLMDTGGNSGSQTSVTVIRGISLNELNFSDIFKVIWKEFRVALLVAITLAICNFVKLLLIDRVSTIIAAVVCITLAFTVLVAKIVGAILPMLAKKIGFDPAVMASPFITTIVDALSLLIYFSVASMLLGV